MLSIARKQALAGTVLDEVPPGSWHVQFEGGHEPRVHPADKLTALPPFPMDGVSLACIRSFRRQFGLQIRDKTTAQACEAVLMPLTTSFSGSLAASLRHLEPCDAAGRPYVAPATVFCSHAWAYKLDLSLDTLEAYAAQQEEPEKVYFWFDLFTNDQHNSPALPQLWWKTTFQQAIERIGATCLILSPWRDPRPLTRAWCLWELLCAVQTGGKLIVLLPPSESQTFKNALNGNFDSIISALSKVDVHRAEAWRESDKQMIHAAVEATIGFSNLNALLIKHLRNWLVEESTAALAKYPVSNAAKMQGAAAAALKGARGITALTVEVEGAALSPLSIRMPSGEPSPGMSCGELTPGVNDMLSMNERAAGFRAAAAAEIAAAAAMPADASAAAAAALSADASAAAAAAAIAAAAPTARAAALRGSFAGEALPAGNGASPQGSFRAPSPEQKRNMAGMTQRWFSGTITVPAVEDKLSEAGQALYDMQRHASPLCTSVCKLLIELGRYDEAAPLADLSLQAHAQLSGTADAGAMNALHTFGVLRMKQGRPEGLEDARQALGSVVAARRQGLGEEHEDTLDSVEQLALVLQNLKLPAEAEPLFRLALAGWRARQALVLHSEASFVKAAAPAAATAATTVAAQDLPPLMKKVSSRDAPPRVARKRRTSGGLAESNRVHLDNIDGKPPIYMRETLGAINNLASLLRAMGGEAAKGSELSESRLEEAETLLTEALAGKKQLLGARHPETLIGVNQLGLLLQARGRLADAEPLMREAMQGRSEVLGWRHPQTLNAMGNLADLLRQCGHPRQARLVMGDAVITSTDVLGAEHRVTTALQKKADLIDAAVAEAEQRAAVRPGRRLRQAVHAVSAAIWLSKLAAEGRNSRRLSHAEGEKAWEEEGRELD